MALTYAEIASSPTFRFLVGKDETPMTIHTALVAKQSRALRKLVSGSMEEAQTKTAIWDDVDEETFGLFAQFVYTGDYTPPSHVVEDVLVPRPRSASPPEPVPSLPEPEIEYQSQIYEEPVVDTSIEALVLEQLNNHTWGTFAKKAKKVKKGKSSHPDDAITAPKLPRVHFHNLSYPTPDLPLPTSPTPNTHPAENFTPVLLGHARLYVLAEKYDIHTLQALVLHKLHRTLCIFTQYEARYGDVVELARYVYAHTPSRRWMDKLREMVVQYMAYEAKPVAGCRKCMELVEENGGFASDLLGMVLERVT